MHKYICRVETPQKKSEREQESYKPHAVLRQEDVDSFFNTLMEKHQAQVFALLDEANDAQRHYQELQALQEEARRLRLARYQAEQEKRAQAEVNASVVADETDADFALWVEKALAKLTRQEREAEEAAQRRAEEKRALIQAIVPLSDLERQGQAWCDLSIQEKNRLLRSIYECFEFVGEPPHEELRPVLRIATPYPVPNIVLKTETRQGPKNTQHRRAMPPVEEWITRVSQGRRGYAAWDDLQALQAAAAAGEPWAQATDARESHRSLEGELLLEAQIAADPEGAAAHYQAQAEKLLQP
jgi:hypothetical protein